MRADGRNNLHRSASGSLELPFQVPNSPGLLGLTLYFQAAERLPPQFERQTHVMPSRFAIGNPLLLPVTE